MTGEFVPPAVRDDVALMAGYHSAQVQVDVRLNTNEAPEAPPDAFRDAVAARLGAIDWHRYPERAASELRAKIAEVEATTPERVFAANGSNEVLQSIMLAYGGPGRRAMTFEPTYALHAHISRVCGTEVIEVERNADFTIDPEVAVAAIREHRPSVVFLCSPNNPTGRAEPAAVVDAVLAACIEVGSLVVVDEAYGQFADRSALSLVDEQRPLCVTRTFSKTWSMAAARLGYLVGPSWLVESLERVVLPYHLDAVTQAAGIAALDFEDEMLARVASLVEERGRVADALAELDVDVWPSQANFILFRPRSIAGTAVWNALVEQSVLVRDCSSWPRLDDCLRVTMGTPEENGRFLDALSNIVGGPT